MKKSCLLLSISLFFYQLVVAQKIGKADYDFLYRQKVNHLPQKGTLYFDGKQSLFVWNLGKEPELFQQDGVREAILKDPEGLQIYKNFPKKQMRMREFAMMEIYVSEEPTMPKFNWKMTGNKRKIGEYECQEATCSFRGRDWVVWFAPTIPISDGPWKFYGLPGLIIEAEDSKKDIMFRLTSIEYPCEKCTADSFKFSEKGKKVDFATYIKAEDIEFEKARQKAIAEHRSRGVENFDMKKIKFNKLEEKFD
ncbi:MAG: GLPGLI family protein [Raineya sp.]|nr:GLPGLI family protein [Raineya sp.]MDW8297444.1 GLPGLI family protein [Raineya sp.]